ncbi:hypothetical protein [Roseibium aquae]|uniref:hypothetical protein n=1 Tax=Roseibium aquae TaxID=1323746 RepID=UPI001FCA75E2|nr:hypothetical protein [Roseibium aquae]
MFTRFGGTIEPRVQAQLTRGTRLRAVLRQNQYAPMRLAEEVALVLAVQEGLLDELKPGEVASFRASLARARERGAGEVLRKVETTGKLDEADKAALLAVLRELAASQIADNV